MYVLLRLLLSRKKKKSSNSLNSAKLICCLFSLLIFTYHYRLQNSPYFCVFKYARALKQKVWNEAENRERDWGETLKIRTVRFAYVIFVRITRFCQPQAIPIG